MSLRLAYLIFWQMLELVLLSYHTSSAKDIELLVLRHEVAKIGQSEHFTHRAAGPPAMLHRRECPHRRALRRGNSPVAPRRAVLDHGLADGAQPGSGAEVDQTGVGTR